MRFATFAALLLSVAATSVSAQATDAHPGPRLNWGPAPANFPAGAEMAVLQGNPAGTGLFTVRLRMPSGYVFPPHWHPTDEVVTVISGNFHVGMGKTFTTQGLLQLPAGGFVVAPANEAHYAITRGVTVVQVHAQAPFSLTYVNPDDAPKASARR